MWIATFLNFWVPKEHATFLKVGWFILGAALNPLSLLYCDINIGDQVYFGVILN